MEMLGIGADIVSVLITFVILIGVLLGKKNTMNEYFPTMLLLNALTIFCDIGKLTFMGEPRRLLLLQIFLIMTFSFVYCSILAFNLYVDKMLRYQLGKKSAFRVVPFIGSAIMITLWILSMETGWLYTIDENYIVVYDRNFWLTEIVGITLTVLPVGRILVNQMMGKLESGIAGGIYSFVALPLIAAPISELLEIHSLLYSAMTVSYLIMFITIHVRQEQKSLEQEAVEEKMQTELIMSQIQPHFIYNSLTTIRYLCSSNPQLAMEAVTKFTKYLRRNLDIISEEKELVTFRDELQHTKNYLWLEQLRFGQNLLVEYDIGCDEFLIPPLSLQPIVENAVKHGITKKIGGGCVWISVKETPKCYKITVKDDGVGFDKQAQATDNEAHIGIDDVRKRISKINGSTITVNSKVGAGTIVNYEIIKDE